MRELTFLHAKRLRFGKTFDAALRPREQTHPKLVWSAVRTYGRLTGALDTLREASDKGWALLGAGLRDGRTLEGVSRESQVDPDALQDVLRLDFDGPAWPRQPRVRPGVRPVRTLAAMLEALGLAGLRAVHHWSSSMGIKPGLRVHVLVELETPLPSAAIANWMAAANAGPLRELHTLTDSGVNVSWALDRALAHCASLLFLGDPGFATPDQDPFKGKNRWGVLWPDAKKRFDLVDPGPPSPHLRAEVLNALRAKKGLPKLPDKFKTRKIQNHQVLVDPKVLEGVSVTDMWPDGDWIRCNLNNGDSNAYYARAESPKLLFSFKPDEPVYRMQDVCSPEFQEALKQHGEDFAEKHKPKNPSSIQKKDDRISVLGVDRDTGAYFVWLAEKNKLGGPRFMPKGAAVDVFRSATGAAKAPNPIQHWTIVYDPWKPQYDLDAFMFNKYVPPEIDPHESPWPTIHALIQHVVPEPEAEQFLYDWLAWIWQNRTKPITGLLMQGAMGTGKNLVIEEIMFPVVGPDNTATINFTELVSDYNTFLGERLLVHIEEIHAAAFIGYKGKEAMAIWRQLTTGAKRMSREIFQAKREIELRAAFVLSSNSHVPLASSLDDRRVSYMPRQETPLTQTGMLDEGIDKFKAKLKSELPGFAWMLAVRGVTSDRVSSPLRNAARDQALEDSVPPHDQTARAIADRDGDFFLVVAEDRDLPGANHDYASAYGEFAAMARSRYHAFLRALVDAASRDKEHFVPTAQWQHVFVYVCEWTKNQRVGWITRRHGVTMDSVSKIDGIAKRGHSLKWIVDPERLEGWRVKFENDSRRNPNLKPSPKPKPKRHLESVKKPGER